MRRLIPIVIVAAAVLAAYAGLLTARDVEFVYDDVRFVSENEAVHDLENPLVYFTDPATVDPGNWAGIYRPVRTLDFAVDFAWFGASPFWFHLRSVLYHAIGALLVLGLLRQWGAGEAASTLGALVFALHPVQVESVAWITSRGDLLCLVFFLLALILHGRGGRWGMVGAAAALVPALFSKEVAVMFPAAALLADFFFRDGRRLRTTLRRWPQYLVYGVLAGAYVALWLSLHRARGAGSWHLPEWWGGSFVGTLFTMSRGLVYYARLLLFPVDMAQDYFIVPVSSPDLLTLACAAVVLGVVVAAIVRAFRGGGALSFAVLWFCVTLFPASNIPGPIGIPTAERFLYLPMAGLALPAGLLLARLWRMAGPGRAAVTLLLCCLVAVSADRALVWTTEDVLWETTLRRVDSPRGLERRAASLRDQAYAAEDPEEARRLFLEALAMHDRQFRLWAKLPVPEGQMSISGSNRLLVLIGLGRDDPERYDEALREAESLLRASPGLPEARAVVALALLGNDRRGEAKQAMDRLLADTEDARVLRTAGRFYLSLAEAYLRDGNKALAWWSLRRSLDVVGGPKRNPAADRALGVLEEEYTPRYDALERVRSRSPHDRNVRRQLAKLNARYGRFREARRNYDDLLRGLPAPRPPDLLFSMARWYWELQDTPAGYRAAAELYREIRKDSPEWEPARVEERLRVCRER